MINIGMHEAKTRLSELVKQVERGESVYLTNRGQVVAEIVLPKQRRKQSARVALRKLQRVVKTNPLGSFDEVMAWRREGL